ncbi:hypothetical protein ACHAPT_003462 [Fusarium lateritium]
MALLANLLAVGLGSLFNENQMTATYPETMRPAFASRFNNASIFDLDSYLRRNSVARGAFQDHMYVAMANITSNLVLPPWVSQEYFFQRYEFQGPDRNKTADTFTVSTRGFGADANCTTVPASKLPMYDVKVDPNSGYPYFPEQPKTEKLCASTDDYLRYAGLAMRRVTQGGYKGPRAIEYCRTLSVTDGLVFCDKTLTLGWGRGSDIKDYKGEIEASFMTCRPFFQTAMFNVTVDSSGHVISYKRTSDLETTLGYADSTVHTDIIFQTANRQWNNQPEWHNDALATDWMSYFLTVKTGSRAILDAKSSVPDSEKLKPMVTDLYRRTYAILLGLNEQIFEAADKNSSVMALRHTRESRIFMEQASFIITMTVLAMNTVVAVLFYTKAVSFVLPRMPTTLGSIIAYIAPSRLIVPNYWEAPGNGSRTLSFGRYIGSDGKVHIGIEADPHVVPVNPSSLEPRTGLFGFCGMSRLRSKKQPIETGTWL